MIVRTSLEDKTLDQIYRDVSEEKKQALLLLGDGLAVGEASFRRILELEDQYRLIAPTYPPVGSMDELIDGLVAILDRA